MWRSDLMIDDEAGSGPVRPPASERMLRKGCAMFAAYLVAGGVLAYALAKLGVSDRWWRGVIVICALWLGHLDAASWVPRDARDSAGWGRLLARGAELSRRRPSLVWLICMSPLASGMLAMEWSHIGRAYVLGKVVHGALMWLFGIGLASVAASLLSPAKLAAIEASGTGKRARAFGAARSTWIDLCAALAFWFFFCDVAGWV